MIAGRFPSAAAAGHWTVNDGRQSVNEGERFNQRVDDEGRRL